MKLSPLLAACLRFSDQVDRHATSSEVILALDAAVRPTVRVFGIWCVPSETLRGSRKPYPSHYHYHPDIASFVADFWPKFQANGPSILARHAWQHHRDFSLRDIVKLRHKPADLWVFQLLRKHHIGDVKYLALFGWWYGVYWSPRSVSLTREQWQALRLAAIAAAERIEELEGRIDADPKLTERERAVLRCLRDGHTEVQAGRLLKVTTSSVKAYVKRAKRKLGTQSIPDTVAEALRRLALLAVMIGLGAAGIWDIYDIHWWD